MSEKIWVIEDPGERKSRKPKNAGALSPKPRQKSPALAFSLSIFIWGGGQFYNGQHILGLFFVLLMLVFFTTIGFLIPYWNAITDFLLKWSLLSFRGIFAGCALFYLSGLTLWIFNACQAYFRALRRMREAFQGVSNPALPLLCSLFVPGWGQFLNGQVKKGFFFLAFALAGFFAVPVFMVTPLLWHSMRTPDERLFLEGFFTAAILVSPAVILMWFLSAFDALKICLDPVKKEPLWNRIVYARNRIRMQGLIRGGIPHVKWTLLLLIVLVISSVLGYSYFPKQRYVALLQELRTKMVNSEMVILPRLIGDLLRETANK